MTGGGSQITRSIQPIIDVHAHVTPQRFQKAVLAGREWHGMTAADGELDNRKNRWPPHRRIEEMDALGVVVQLLSPTDCFYQYHRDPAVTARIAVECNEEVAEMVRNHPDRFMGLGTLPLQDIPGSIAEMERSRVELGLKGFMIDDQVNGVSYDHPSFDAFWEAASDLGAFLLTHQGEATVVTHRVDSYFLANTVGNLVDRTLSFGCLVYGGVVDKYPSLQICLGHGGGYVPYAIDRMDKGWEAMPALRGMTRDRPSTYLRRFFYDSVTYTDRNLRFLIDTVGIDRVLFGTDWPAPMTVDDPVNRIRRSEVLTADEGLAILGRNTAQLFS
ncbi:MAG: amidohydrolase family protein [Acidimicrobiia bacterium]